MLLGKNVVGGALSVITAKPTFDSSGNVLVSYGNHNSMLVSGFVNGGLNDSWASRLSFQGRKHDGYAEDVLHHRDVEDLESYQGRLQFLYGPTARSSRVASRSITTRRDQRSQHGCRGRRHDLVRDHLPAHQLRARGATCVRISVSPIRAKTLRRASSMRVSRVQQFMKRDGFGVTLDLQYEASGFTVQLAHRLQGRRRSAGVRPDRAHRGYIAFINTTTATRPATSNNGQFLFGTNPSARTRTFSSSARNSGSRPTIRTAARLDRWRVLEEGRHQQGRPLHRRELPRQRDSRRQQSAVDVVGREPLGERRQDRELRRFRADRLQVH